MTKPAVRQLHIIAWILLTAVSLVFTACSSPNGTTSNASPGASATGSNNKAKLRIMFQKADGANDQITQWMQQTVDLYKSSHPNVDFEVIANASGDDYLTLVTTEMASNNAPDIMQGWTLERMRPFAEANRLLNLKPYITGDAQWKDKLSADAMKATTFRDNIYGIPLTQDAEVVYYNKEVFAKYNLQEPKTYDDLYHIIDVLKANNIVPMTLPNQEPWVGSIVYYFMLERLAGMGPYEKTVIERSGKWTDDAFAQTGQLLQDLIARGAFEKNVSSVSRAEAVTKLVEGKAAMYTMGTWVTPTLLPKMGDKLGFFNWPNMAGGKAGANDYILIPNVALSIGANTKHPQEAVDFLKFAFSQERQLEFAKLGFLTMFKTELKPGDLPAINADLLKSIGAATGSMYPWDVPLGVTLGKEFYNAITGLYSGGDPKKLFEALQKSFDSLK